MDDYKAGRRLTIAPEAAESPGFFARRYLSTDQDDVFLNVLLGRISDDTIEPTEVPAAQAYCF